MIVLLNGAFGVGKTTTARLLARELPNSLLFDPELVGFFLRAIPRFGPKPEDFQDEKLWCPLVVVTARALRFATRRNLIVPMCLWNPVYLERIVSGLRDFEPNLHHFCLTASLDTIQIRLRKRGETEGSWPWLRAERCRNAHAMPLFAHHIPTDNATAEKIAQTILLAIRATP